MNAGTGGGSQYDQFFLDTILTGQVLGVGPGSTREDVESALGRSYVDDDHGSFIRRDYGLLEFTFTEEAAFACAFVIVEVGRIAFFGAEPIPADQDLVPAAILSRYPGTLGRVAIDSLIRRLADAGCTLLMADGEEGDVTYVAAHTGCVIHVSPPSAQVAPDWPGPGEVTQIDVYHHLAGWWQAKYGLA